MYPGIHAKKSPDKAAIIIPSIDKLVTYQQLEERSLRLANWFRAIGLKRGDVVALMAENDARIFDVYWATQRAGLYMTAINYRLRADETKYILENSGAKVLIVGSIHLPWNEVFEGASNLEVKVSFEGGDHVNYGFQCLEEIIHSASDVCPDIEPRGGDMLYSSGTTGRPKGVRPPLPDRDVKEPGDTMVSFVTNSFGFSSETIYLSPAPLYHAAPLRTCAAVHALGGTVIVMDKFEAECALELISRYRVNASQWVPTMFVRMLKLGSHVRQQYDVSSLKVAIHAAAPCPVDVKREMMNWWGPILYEYYSCSELNGITVIGPDDWFKKPGSVGKAVLGIVRICDDEGKVLPVNADGTVYFEREEMPFQYHGDEEKTRSTQHPDHPTWTAVGDIGHLDDDGYLYLTDRKAFMIISGGVNIYPQEVESALTMHPLISDIAVIGVPDQEMGEQVKAVVVLASGVEPSQQVESDIIEFAKSKVASYKAPKSIDFVDALPRNPVGKLVKGDLRKRYWPS